jgi:hypothetical protein
MKHLARYLAKYVVSPPMALSRIVAYDRECSSVTYWYRDHQRGGQRTQETVSRETFIGRMVQHILPKGFQRIRYYGLQATCILKQVRERVLTALQVTVQQTMEVAERPDFAAVLPNAYARHAGTGPAHLPAVWPRDVAVADLASAVWGGL